MKLLKINLNKTLIILLVFTFITILLGEGQITSAAGYGTICIIIVIKSVLIISNFMELRDASPAIYIPMVFYIIFFASLIFISSFLV